MLKGFCFRSLLEAGGVDRLMNVTRQRAKYTSRFFLQMMLVMMIMIIILDRCFRHKKSLHSRNQNDWRFQM